MTWFAYGEPGGQPLVSLYERHARPNMTDAMVGFPIDEIPTGKKLTISATAPWRLIIEDLPLTWNDIKRERGELQDRYAWTTAPASPLSTICQQEFLLFQQKLHRLTVDFPSPEAVVWPPIPELTYGPSPI